MFYLINISWLVYPIFLSEDSERGIHSFSLFHMISISAHLSLADSLFLVGEFATTRSDASLSQFLYDLNTCN
jgi:hypothetical protein